MTSPKTNWTYVDYWNLEEVEGVTPTVIGSIWKADFLTIS